MKYFIYRRQVGIGTTILEPVNTYGFEREGDAYRDALRRSQDCPTHDYLVVPVETVFKIGAQVNRQTLADAYPRRRKEISKWSDADMEGICEALSETESGAESISQAIEELLPQFFDGDE